MMKTVQTLLLCITSCVAVAVYAAGPTVSQTFSPDFAYVGQIEYPCNVAPNEQFEVVLRMSNTTNVPLLLTQGIPVSGTFLTLPAIFVFFNGALLQSFVADDGTEFTDVPLDQRFQVAFDNGVGELPAQTTKELRLTLQAADSGIVDFSVFAANSPFAVTCAQQVLIPIEIGTCPVSDRTVITVERVFLNPDVIARVSYPNQVNVGDDFMLEYTLINNSTDPVVPQFWNGVLPRLSDGANNFFIFRESVASIGTDLDISVNEFPIGQGQGRWIINQPIPAGESRMLQVTLQATDNAAGNTSFITQFRNMTGFQSDECAVGPVSIRIVGQDEPVEGSTDPVVDAINSLVPCTFNPTF